MQGNGLIVVLMSTFAAGFMLDCHSSTRDNSLDPDLTPAVTLSVKVDSTAGVANLTWTRFAGDQTFAAYRIWRRVTGLIAADSIATVSDDEQTTLADTTIRPDQDYVYWVEVVNAGGLVVPSDEVQVGSFTVVGVRLVEVVVDNLIGQVSLNWTAYDGPGFEQYEVWRTAFGQSDTLLHTNTELADTTATDTSPEPGTEYTYWIVLSAAGESPHSSREEISYQLLPVDLQEAVFSAETATADLRWSAYRGPRFAGYEVRRQSGDLSELTVATLEGIQSTAFTDSSLDGNTEYVYRIVVRTGWDQLEVSSNLRSDRFYGLVDTRDLPPQSNSRVQAVDMAFDEAGELYVAATLVSTTTADVMLDGIRLKLPGRTDYRRYFQNQLPDRLSPIHLVVAKGVVYVTVRIIDDAGSAMFVGAADPAGSNIWELKIDADGEQPVGLHVLESGEIWLIDRQGWLHVISPDGVLSEADDALRVTLEANSLPVEHLVVGRGVGLAENDQFFMLVPFKSKNHVIGKTWLGNLFGGNNLTFADGVGPENGQTLNPLRLAFDASRTRLVVLEELGRLQVLNARVENDREKVPRYITKWGVFGSGPGEFHISPPTAVDVIVDDQGRIYVADGEERIQIFAP